LTGARWLQILWRTAALADVLTKASLDATNLDVEFSQAQYGIHCTRLRVSVLASELITSQNLSLHYSGSLGAMDLTRLNAFLEIAQHTRIKSGSVQEVAFEIDVTAGQASGRVRAIYRDLEITVLDKQTGTEKGFNNRVASFLVKLLKIRNANAPEGLGSSKEGKVDYARRPDEEFQEFVWYALRTGVLDIISH
jgi:hypothetical protein